MLLDRTRVLTFGWWTILWAVIAILGLFKMSRAFQFPAEGGMVWGTTLFFVGLYTVLEDFGVTVLCCTPSYFTHMIEKAAEMNLKTLRGLISS